MTAPGTDEALFTDAIAGLEKGDFTRLERLFMPGAAGQPSQIVQWHARGLFGAHTRALNEALTCACFLGQLETAEYLLQQGLSPAGGVGTGMNAFHWAANRGQLEAVRLLVRWKAPLEPRSMYGGNVLDTAVWSSVNEPKESHPAVIEALLQAGARLNDEDYPVGREDVDALLRKYLA